MCFVTCVKLWAFWSPICARHGTNSVNSSPSSSVVYLWQQFSKLEHTLGNPQNEIDFCCFSKICESAFTWQRQGVSYPHCWFLRFFDRRYFWVTLFVQSPFIGRHKRAENLLSVPIILSLDVENWTFSTPKDWQMDSMEFVYLFTRVYNMHSSLAGNNRRPTSRRTIKVFQWSMQNSSPNSAEYHTCSKARPEPSANMNVGHCQLQVLQRAQSRLLGPAPLYYSQGTLLYIFLKRRLPIF